MSSVFTINFRREAFLRERAMTRARVISLGVWLSYFGALVVVFGLYGLNFVAVVQHTRMLERQTAAQARAADEVDWSKQATEMLLIERGVVDGHRWRERLARLSAALPANAQLTSMDFNPGGVVGGPDWNRLVLAGVLRVEPQQDRMRGVSDLVARLQSDSVLTAHFRNIRLSSTRINETSGTTAEFVIECRP